MPKKPLAPVRLSASGKTLTIELDGIKTVRRVTSITRQVERINSQSWELSMEFEGMNGFTDELGQTAEITDLIREEWYNVIDAIKNGGENIQYIAPQVLQQSINTINKIATSKTEFYNSFYGYVGRYYEGPDNTLSPKEVEKHLREGNFEIPWEEVEAYSEYSDYGSDGTALQAWILDNIPNADSSAINNANIAELRYIVGRYERNETLPEKYATKRVRKTIAGRWHRSRAGIKGNKNGGGKKKK